MKKIIIQEINVKPKPDITKANLETAKALRRAISLVKTGEEKMKAGNFEDAKTNFSNATAEFRRIGLLKETSQYREIF